MTKEQEKKEKEEKKLKVWFLIIIGALITIFFVSIYSSGDKNKKQTEKEKTEKVQIKH